MAADPDTISSADLATALTAAWELAHRGDGDAATGRFEALAERYPQAPDPAIDLGICYAAAGRFEDALGTLRRGLELAPGRDDAHYNLGIALEYTNDPQGALASYVRALELNPHFLEAGMRLGGLLERAGDAQQACQAYLRIGMALSAGERAGAAVAPLAAAVRLNPNDALARYGLGNALLAAGSIGEARATLQHAVELNGDFPEALNSLGLACYHLGEIDEARRCFEAALERKTIFPAARNNLGNCLARRGEHAAAVRQYRFAANQAPNYADAHFNAAQELHMLGRDGEAERACRDALALRPHDALAHTTLAWLLLARGDFAHGWREFEWRARTPGDGYLPHPLAADTRLPLPSSLLPLDLAGLRVGVIGSGGLGTELFFLRFVPALRARGVASIHYLTDARLRALVERCGWFDAVDDLAAPAQRDYDLLLSGCELPLVLGYAGGKLPGRDLRIRPSARARDAIAVRLGAVSAPVLALTWRAGLEGDGPRRKQVPLDALARAVRDWPGRVISVQRGALDGELEALSSHLGREVEDFGDINDDLDLALALFERAREYVGVSNTNMYLAACVGLAGRVLVKRPLEWRWAADADGVSRWFPGFALYPEAAGGGWDRALAALRRDLAAVATGDD